MSNTQPFFHSIPQKSKAVEKRPARLSQPKSFKLASWIAANADTLQGKSFKDIATLATEHLEFPVSAVSITNHAEIAGVKLSGRVAADGTTSKSSDRVQVVAIAVRALYESLGMPVPEGLAAVCKRQSPTKAEPKA